MALIYTTTVGGDPNIVELSTPSHGVERALVQSLADAGALVTTPPAGRLEWDLGAPLVLTAQPAGHEPGYYTVLVSLYMRVAAVTGNVNIAINWGEPGVGAAVPLTFNAVNVQLAIMVFTVDRSLQSAGILPITASFTPNIVTGVPRGNVIATAVRNCALVT